MQIPGWGLQETSEERDPTGMKGRRASQGFYPLPVGNSWKTEEEPSETQQSRKVQTHQHAQTGSGTPKGEETSKAALSVPRGTPRVLRSNLFTSEGSKPEEPEACVRVRLEEPSLNRDGVLRHFPPPTGNTVLHQRSRVHAGSCDPADAGEPPPAGQRPCWRLLAKHPGR